MKSSKKKNKKGARGKNLDGAGNKGEKCKRSKEHGPL